MSLKSSLLSLSLLALPLAVGVQPVAAEPIGFIERYALADDRIQVLQSLIPGSEEYYFYHCLHYQVTGDLNRAEAMLADWEQAVDGPFLNETPSLVAIRDRQRLLTYGASPDRTIEYLRMRLGVQLNHTAPPTAGQRQWSDTLDADLLAADRIIDEALRNVGSSRVDLQACKLEYSIVSPK